MRIRPCPIGRPIAAQTFHGLSWPELVLSWLSAATFTPKRRAK
jgi:hypothetical protein